MLHITNGDSAAGLIRACGVGGDVLPWRDVLHEGPVPAGLNLEQLSRARASFIADQGWGRLAQTQEQFRERDRALSDLGRHEEVVLWFEHDLYDQLQILQILDRIGRHDGAGGTNFSLICIDRFPGIDRFVGLGQLEPPQAASLFPGRRPVTEAQIELAIRAWQAFRSPDPTAVGDVLSTDGSDLPFLAAALWRHLEQFPAVRNGLGRTEQQILDRAALGETSAADLFRNDQTREARPFLGDLTFFSYLERLADAPRPLVRVASAGPDGGGDRRVVLTDVGRDVLTGRSDAVDLNGVDRWWGGVHQTGRSPLWRWDDQHSRLVKTSEGARNGDLR